jgi:hypothetical protein
MITTPEAKLKFQQFIDGIPECIATVKKHIKKEVLYYSIVSRWSLKRNIYAIIVIRTVEDEC